MCFPNKIQRMVYLFVFLIIMIKYRNLSFSFVLLHKISRYGGCQKDKPYEKFGIFFFFSKTKSSVFPAAYVRPSNKETKPNHVVYEV